MSTVITSRIPPAARRKSLRQAPAINAILLASCLMMLTLSGEALAQPKCGTNLQHNNCVQEWQCSSSGEGTNGNWVPKANEPTGTPCTTTSGLAGKCVAPSRLPGGSIEAATCVANCATSSNGCGSTKSGTGTNKGSGSNGGACTATAKSCNLECGRPGGDLTMQEWNACQSSCLSCGKDQDGGGGSPGPTNNNAIVANVIQTPIYVNLYWDTTWDVDNPSMTMAAIDNFTASMVSSSYFGGLQEYGVTGATFAGSFVPDGACTAKAPGSVGLYDPVSASILGFLNCELVNAGIPQGPNVIYNLLLPQGSLESDLFGGLTFCGNGGVSWHFHQTPYTPAGALAVATAYGGETGNFFAFLSGLATGDPALIAAGLSSIGPISAAQLLTSFEGLQGPPFYTIVSVDSRCDPNAPADQNTNGVIANNLMHEMLEAATDPSPSVAAILSGGIANGEIVDKADDANAANSALCAPSTPFQAPPVLGISCPGGISPFFSFICFKGYAPQYWSNASQNCTIGFTSTAMPNISGASIAGTESQLSLTLTGSGFGPTPILQPSGAGGGQPYVGLANLNPSHPWEAGINGGESSPGLTLHSWSDTNIVLSGLQFDGGDLVLSPTDSLAAWVCNPASGQCSVNSQAVSSTVSGTPRIQVIVEDAWNANVPLDIAIDGVTVARNIDNNGGSGWLTGLAPNTPFTVGPSHKVVAKPTTKAFVTTVFLGGCAADGSFVLAEGDNRTCIVSNSAGQCPTGQHCCGTSSTSAGCSTGCISNATSCSKGCPSGTVCCGIISGTGSCRAGVCAVPGKCP